MLNSQKTKHHTHTHTLKWEITEMTVFFKENEINKRIQNRS